MVELRKRPAPPPAAEPARKKSAPKKPAPKKAEPAKVEPTEEAAPKPEAKLATKSGPPSVGDVIDLAGFGAEIEDNEGNKVTLKQLVEASKSGVVLFTYPKASTPGCTKQACLFRDSYAPLTATGLSIYGLSTDSPKANTTFKTKQNLPYPLLCDPTATLIKAIGMKKSPGNGTQRGVFVVDKKGEVLAAEPGGPAPTVEAVKKVVATMGGQAEGGALDTAQDRAAGETEDTEGDDKKVAEVAAEVANTAQDLDATPKP